jgi:hypothetical protein
VVAPTRDDEDTLLGAEQRKPTITARLWQIVVLFLLIVKRYCYDSAAQQALAADRVAAREIVAFLK